MVASCSTVEVEVFHFDIRKRVGAAFLADQQRIIACNCARTRPIFRPLPGRDKYSVRGQPMPFEMIFDFVRAIWIILVPVSAVACGASRRPSKAHGRIIAAQHAARVFPGNRRAGFPGSRNLAATGAAHSPRLVTKL